MGACSSSAGLDPADLTGDGSAPVFWSPERDQEKRQAKLREVRQLQQAEIERATGHLKRHSSAGQRRRTGSKSADEEKHAADDNAAKSPRPPTVQPASAPRAPSRPASVSLPSSPVQRPPISDEELSDFPLPRSARRHARATSASASIASPTRSPEGSVVGSGGGDGDGMAGTPRHQAGAAAVRRGSAVPEAVKEEERYANDEKECDATTTPQPSTPPSPPVAATASPTTVSLRPVAAREERLREVDRPSVGDASAAFGVRLKKVQTVVRSVDLTPAPAVLVAAS